MRLLRFASVVAAVALTTVPAAVAAKGADAECPHGLHCNFVPAAYQQNSADPGDYGNYDLANRPDDGLAVRFVVIHDTEESYDDTLATFENSHTYVSACDSSGQHPQAAQPANFLYLHTAPSESAPYVADPFLAGMGATCAQNWGDKAVTGQSFAVAERAGDWLAIWYGGQKAWLYDPKGKNTVPGGGTLITPKAGLASIPVYGRAYPSSVSTATLGYTIAAGQTYVARDLLNADYYSASTYNARETYSVIRSDEQFYEISFNHRIAFVKATDVDTVS